MASDKGVPPRLVCAHCSRTISNGGAYRVRGGLRCLRCALIDRRLLRRSVKTSLVVGTVLIAINHGGLLISGQIPPALVWQIPLTYAVPFCVATWGALGNSRDQGASVVA